MRAVHELRLLPIRRRHPRQAARAGGQTRRAARSLVGRGAKFVVPEVAFSSASWFKVGFDLFDRYSSRWSNVTSGSRTSKPSSNGGTRLLTTLGRCSGSTIWSVNASLRLMCARINKYPLVAGWDTHAKPCWPGCANSDRTISIDFAVLISHRSKQEICCWFCTN